MSSAAAEVCREWVALALPSLTAVIYAEQAVADGARPTLPYATVEWLGARPMSAVPYVYASDEEVDDQDPESFFYQYAHQRLRGTLRVTFYGDSGAEMAAALGLSKQRVAERAHLRQGGVAVHPISDVIDTTQLRDTVHEPSAQVDYAVVFAAEDKSEVGVIETINTPITITPQGG